jgi:copper chaperone CopZ
MQNEMVMHGFSAEIFIWPVSIHSTMLASVIFVHRSFSMQRLLRPLLPFIAAVSLASPLFAAGEHYSVHVPDMTCESCAAALTTNFGKRAEVATVEADIPTQMLNIQLKPDAELSEATVREVVEASGFTAHHVKAAKN